MDPSHLVAGLLLAVVVGVLFGLLGGGGSTGTAVAGSFVGSALAGRLPERALRTGFGVFVLAMGAFVLSQELPRLLALAPG